MYTVDAALAVVVAEQESAIEEGDVFVTGTAQACYRRLLEVAVGEPGCQRFFVVGFVRIAYLGDEEDLRLWPALADNLDKG